MTASTQPTPLVVMPASELAALLDSVLEKHLRSVPPPAPPSPAKTEFCTRKQAVKRLNVSLTTLNARLRDGSVPFRRVGRRILCRVYKI